MELRTCSDCGRIFHNKFNEQNCPSCMSLKQDEIKRLARFFMQNSKATIQEASTQLSIDINNIISYLRDEKIELPALSDDSIECKRCGKQIKVGKYCNPCKAELINGLNSNLNKKSTEVKPRMRFLTTNRK